MADYIKREDAIEAAIDGADNWDGGFNHNRAIYIRSSINGVPAANVRENVRGKWIEESDVYTFFTCTNCGKTFETERAYNFCPNCGADMRGEQR